MPRLYYGVYRGVLWLIFPVLLVFILIHSVMKKASLKRYLYKLSILRPKLRPGLRRIWIHGVSAGEIASIEKFSEIIGKEFELFISTTTFSGTEMAEKLFSYYDRGLYPFDYPLFCGRMLDRVKPVALVFVEGEIWPNMLRKAGEQGIPCFLISGKLLEKDFRRYNILRGFFKSVLNRYEMVLAQSHRDYERFLQLGISQEKIRLGGSIKMDQPMDESSSGRQDYHGNRRESLLLTAASTHQGEESFVIKLYERLLVKIPYLKLMIAPRKPERSAEIRNIIMSS
ncbi:MAG: hypothetical protein OEZ36_14310, partial [Spirochaetota bacterium]|nr:hypothetical protein [Spirochaetota bacterium]